MIDTLENLFLLLVYIQIITSTLCNYNLIKQLNVYKKVIVVKDKIIEEKSSYITYLLDEE